MALVKKPFFMVNPICYLFGDKALEMAKIADKLAKKYGIDVMFTGQLIDLPIIKQETHNLILTAQHMDPLYSGRGMGHVLPEALKNRGVEAVVLNHAENQLTLGTLDATVKRAKEIGLYSIVCGDTVEQCRAIAELHPNMMICEPTSLIGTGNTSDDSYIEETIKTVKEVDPKILVLEAAGVSVADDVRKVLELGADGTGGTSGIINSPDWEAKLNEMMAPMAKFKGGR